MIYGSILGAVSDQTNASVPGATVRITQRETNRTPHFSNPAANVSNLQLGADGSVKNLGGYSEITGTTGVGREGIDQRQYRFGMRIQF